MNLDCDWEHVLPLTRVPKGRTQQGMHVDLADSPNQSAVMIERGAPSFGSSYFYRTFRREMVLDFRDAREQFVRR